MRRALKKQLMHKRRHRRIRGRVSGTAARPRLAVSRSNLQISVQIIDDVEGHTLCSSTSLTMKGVKGQNLEGAKVVGTDVAKKALEAGIKQVAFDRGGFRYHGRVKALAEAAREAGLDF